MTFQEHVEAAERALEDNDLDTAITRFVDALDELEGKPEHYETIRQALRASIAALQAFQAALRGGVN